MQQRKLIQYIEINVYSLIVSFTIYILYPFVSYSQNLVIDSSFESYKKDPCFYKKTTESINDYLASWTQPTIGTTDMWSSDLSKIGDCSIFIYDNISAHSGKHFVGLYTSYTFDTVHFNLSNTPATEFLNNKNYREYIQVKLSKPLTVGKVYRAEFYTALYSTGNFMSNNLGMLFTGKPLQSATKYALIQSPQINDTTLIADTLWRRIDGTFVADKPYEYLTLGYFFDDVHTKIVFSGRNAVLAAGSYNYIDDVLVEEMRDVPAVTIPDLGMDTSLCPGQSLTIRLPQTSQTRYRWQDGNTAPMRVITQSGTYYVTAMTGVYSVTDTLHVTILPPITLPADTLLCQGETLALIPNYPHGKLVWSTGSTDLAIRVSEPGQYWVRVNQTYCEIVDTIRVQMVECPSSVPNVITPNQDGKNDFFFVKNIELRPWHLKIINRWGRCVYENETYQNEWKADGLPGGSYYYELYIPALRRRLKGWIEVLR